MIQYNNNRFLLESLMQPVKSLILLGANRQKQALNQHMTYFTFYNVLLCIIYYIFQ